MACPSWALCLQAEFEYSLLGYKPEEPPSLLPYVPLCLDQPLLLGAAEELQGGLTVGLLPGCLASLATMDAMPEGLLSNPHTSCTTKSSTQVCAGLLDGAGPACSYSFRG